MELYYELEKMKNQYDEDVVTEWLRYNSEKDRWFHGAILCYSSIAYGMGTCQCVSHEPDYEDVIRKYDAKCYLEEHFHEIPEEAKPFLEHTDIKSQIEEFLEVSHITLDELGIYAELSYQLNANPLPIVRKFFKEHDIDVRIDFAYYQEALCWLPPEEGGPHLICYLDNSNEDELHAWFEWNC